MSDEFLIGGILGIAGAALFNLDASGALVTIGILVVYLGGRRVFNRWGNDNP